MLLPASLTTDRIANLIECPPANVARYWPVIEQCLEPPAFGLNSQECAIAALATVAVETARRFAAIDEFGNDEYFTHMYDVKGSRPAVAISMGNTEPGDGIKYHGRGLVQITWKLNYQHYGQLIGCDLVTHPEVAKELNASCAILAAYFYGHRIHGTGIGDAARSKNWVLVRKLVNGGTNGLDDFLKYVNRLEGVLAARSTSSAGA